MHANKTKKETKDTRFYVVQQKLTSTERTCTQLTLFSMNTTVKNYIVSSSPTPTKLRQRCN